MLHSIENQLDGPVAKDIIKNLEEAQSQYATSFQQIKRDIHKALKETNDILQFWETMKPWFVELHEAINPLDQLRLLPPIVHTLLLVWQYSRFVILSLILAVIHVIVILIIVYYIFNKVYIFF